MACFTSMQLQAKTSDLAPYPFEVTAVVEPVTRLDGRQVYGWEVFDYDDLRYNAATADSLMWGTEDTKVAAEDAARNAVALLNGTNEVTAAQVAA